jgi:uncharacterized protein (TIGR03084 family)
MSQLEQVLVDLAAEGDALEAMVIALTDDQWATPTPAEGWDVAHQVAHLAWTDEVAVLAATDKVRWDEVVVAAMADPYGFVDSGADEVAMDPPSALLRRWQAGRLALASALRDYPAGQKMPWFGPPMSPTSMATARFMETWAHSLDVAEALGVAPSANDRVRHVAFLGAITRGFAFATHGLPIPTDDVYVALTLPSGATWTHGSPDAANSVRGPAYDFALRVTQRAHRDDLDLVAVGPVADQWLDIAQAFAGPPGAGREATS